MVSVLFPTGKSLLIVGYEINFNLLAEFKKSVL